jgi:putative ABC transport system permease protein
VFAIIEDLRYSIRALGRTPLFSGVVILILAIGIGANIAVFSVVDAVMLRSLPYANPEQLAAVVYRGATETASAVPSPAFLAWKTASRTMQSMTAYSAGEIGWLLPDGQPLRVSAAFISSNFFDVIGVPAVERGRALQATDEGVGAAPVAVISDRLWNGRLGGASDVLGRTIRLNGRPYVIVGVAPVGFQFPDAISPDVFLPLTLPASSPVVRSLQVIGRIRAAESTDHAERELIQVTKEAAPTFPPSMEPILARGERPEVLPLQRRLLGDLGRPLVMALVAVGIVLLIACANVAGLLLARAASRDRELWTRIALGATPQRLARLVLSETLLLTTAAGTAALALLYWSMTALRAGLLQTVPHPEAIGVDRRIVVFLVAITLFVTITCTLSPILRLTRSLAHPRSRVRTARFGRMRRWFVVGQVSSSFVLLLTGLLLLQTLWRLEAVRVGFEPRSVWTFRIPALTVRRPVVDTQQAILDRISQLSGVVAVGASTAFPLDGHNFRFTIPVADQPPPSVEAGDATGVDAVSTDYFRTMRIGVLEGRAFDAHDSPQAPAVAIVNQAFVRSVLDSPRALGRRIALGGGPQDATITIVGVVENVKDGNPGDPVPPIVYRPFAQATTQMGWPTIDVVIRTASEPTAIAKDARDAVRDIAPTATLYDENTMEGRFARVLTPERQRAALFGLFACAAVLLAIVGLYGLLNYSVTRELPEFGIRLALGASPAELFVQVLLRGALPTFAGVAVGICAARFLTALFARLLYGIAPTDALTYAISAAAMLALSLVASYFPARRAMSVDPLTLLRVE